MKRSWFFPLLFLAILCLLTTLCYAQISNDQLQKIQVLKTKAMRYESQDKLDEALNEWKAILDMKAIDNEIMKEALINIAKINLKKGGSSYEDALTALKELIRIDPNNIEAHCKLGGIYFDRKLYNDAVVQFGEVVKLVPENGQAHFKLGEVYFNKKQFNLALIEFNKAKDKLEDSYEKHLLLYHLGCIHNLQNNYDQAIIELRKALEFDNSNIDAHLLLCEVYIKMKRYFDASQENHSALSIDPNNKQANENLIYIQSLRSVRGQIDDHLAQGNKLFDENRWADSINEFEIILELDSTISDAKEKIKLAKTQIFYFHINRGKWFTTNRQWQKAREEFANALNFVIAKDQLLLAEQELSNAKGALNFLTKVDSITSNGISAVDREEWEKAQQIFEAVLLLDPKRPDIEKMLREVNSRYFFDFGKKAMSKQEWGWADYCFKKVPEIDIDYSEAVKKIEELNLISVRLKRDEIYGQFWRIFS